MAQNRPDFLVFDIETDGLLDGLTKVHCLVVYDPARGVPYRFNNQGTDGAGSIEEGLTLLDSAAKIIGHSIVKFDIPALQKVYPGWEPKAKLVDTLVLSRLIWTDLRDADFRRKQVPPRLTGSHGLEAWGYRLDIHKGDFGKTTDWREWSPAMEEYCEQDVWVTSELWKRICKEHYSQQAVDLEHQFASIIQQQERHGFGLDRKVAQDLYATLSKRRYQIEEDLQAIFPPRFIAMKTPAYWEASEEITLVVGKLGRWLTKDEAVKVLRHNGVKNAAKFVKPGPLRTKEIPFNPGSEDQIAARLTERYGWKPVEFTPGGKPMVTEAILKNLQYPESPLLRNYLMVQKRVGQIAEGNEAWLKLERNGRIYGSVNTNGAVTGRCTHSHPNVAQTPAVYSPYGPECRSCWVPTEGFNLVGWDASSLELRCLAHYLGRYDEGAYAKVLLEGDVHLITCEALGLNPKENYVFAANHGTGRDVAKKWKYAFIYGAGEQKLGALLGGNAKKGRMLKKRFFKTLPALKRLKETVDRTVDRRGHLIGLDGRRLHVRSKHAALNTLLQSAGALAMKQAAVFQYQSLLDQGLRWGEDFAFVANIHDEIQTEARPDAADAVGKAGVEAIRRAGNHFNFRCPLDGEYKIGDSWAETH